MESELVGHIRTRAINRTITSIPRKATRQALQDAAFRWRRYVRGTDIARAECLEYYQVSPKALHLSDPRRLAGGVESLNGIHPLEDSPSLRSHGRGRRGRLIVATAILTLVAASVLQFRDVQAAQPFPTATDFAWYVTASNDSFATMRQLGCGEGSARASDNSNSEVILDFGGQDPNYSQTLLPFHDAYLSYDNAIGDAEWFAIGYYECTRPEYWTVLKLGIGATNDNALGEYNNLTNATNAGTAWSQVAQVVYNYVASQHMNGQVSVWGATDMETEWASQAPSLAWSNGFAAGSLGYVDYGDAGGCSYSGYTGGSGYGCNGDWNQYGVWYKSWGAPPAYPLPEIYNDYLAHQWWLISQYGYYIQGGARLTFDGPLDEYDRDPSTFNNIQAWDDLSNYLEQDPNTNVPMTYSVEIH